MKIRIEKFEFELSTEIVDVIGSKLQEVHHAIQIGTRDAEQREHNTRLTLVSAIVPILLDLFDLRPKPKAQAPAPKPPTGEESANDNPVQ